MPVGRGPATYPLRCVSVIMSVGDVAQSAPFSSPQLSDPDMIDSLRRSIMEGLTIQTCAFRRCLDHTRKFRHAQLALRLATCLNSRRSLGVSDVFPRTYIRIRISRSA